MFGISSSVFAKQVSHILDVGYKITSNLLRHDPRNVISHGNAKACFSQKIGAPIDGSDKDPPSKLNVKVDPPNLKEADKAGTLLNSAKKYRYLSKYATSKITTNLKSQLKSKTIDTGHLNPSSLGSQKKCEVDYCRKLDYSTKPTVSEKPSVQYRSVASNLDHLKKSDESVAYKDKDILTNQASVKQESARSDSTHSPEQVLDCNGYVDKGFADNWTPLVKFSPIPPTSGGGAGGMDQKTAPICSNLSPQYNPAYSSQCQWSSENPATVAVESSTESLHEIDKTGVNYDNISGHWIPSTNSGDLKSLTNETCATHQETQDNAPCDWAPQSQSSSAPFQISASSASFQAPGGPGVDDQSNWIATPQYFAADFTQRQDDAGSFDNQMPNNWMTQYRADCTQPAGGSGASPYPSDSSNEPCEKTTSSNRYKQSIYNIRKHSPELPSDSTELQFQALGDMPTGIFRYHKGECLGPGAKKGGEYQNPEYFAFHNMTYYDLHLLLRDFRQPNPDTRRKR